MGPRGLEPWPSDMAVAGDPPLRQYDVLVSTLDLISGLEHPRATVMVEQAQPSLVPQLPPLEAAELLQRAGDFLSEDGETERGMQMIMQAVTAYEKAQPCDGHARALFVMQLALRRVGRYEESAAAIARGVQVAAALEGLAGGTAGCSYRRPGCTPSSATPASPWSALARRQNCTSPDETPKAKRCSPGPPPTSCC